MGAATIFYIITTLPQNNVFMAIATVSHHNLYNFTAVISSLSLSLLASRFSLSVADIRHEQVAQSSADNSPSCHRFGSARTQLSLK